MTARPRLPLPPLPDLAAELERLVALIPAGSVTTYGELARALGSRHAAIWVSQWPREQAEHGSGFARRIVGLKDLGELDRFSDFPDSKPLAPLEVWLKQAAAFVDERPLTSLPRMIAGVDVAYPSSDRAVAAAVLVDGATGSVLHQVSIEHAVRFPYISGFLTFRELPAMIAACKALPQSPEVVMVDGQGRLHPHRGGVATGFAAATGWPTIGIAKSLLCGTIESVELPEYGSLVRRILLDGAHLGFAVRASTQHAPVYVSVGGWLSLENALDITRSLLGRTRLPLPTHLADRKTKAEARRRSGRA